MPKVSRGALEARPRGTGDAPPTGRPPRKESHLNQQRESHVGYVNSRETNLRGGYIQAGYFFNELNSKIPRQLELAGRYAFVDPRTGQPNDLIPEPDVVANWFLRGHADKISVDVCRYALVVGQNAPRSRVGVRVQWAATF